MGSLDRIIRLILGLVLIAGGLVLQVQSGHLWWLVLPGALMVITSSAGVCPAYIPFKLSTKKKD
jgi:flagellar motor component MotA